MLSVGVSVRQEKFVSNEARGWEYVSNKGVCVKLVTHTSIVDNLFHLSLVKRIFLGHKIVLKRC